MFPNQSGYKRNKVHILELTVADVVLAKELFLGLFQYPEKQTFSSVSKELLYSSQGS